MKNLRSFFNQKRVCAPLVNLQGSHVRKYRAFRIFLEHNHAALSAIADLEQAYYSGRSFSLSWAGARYEALWEAALGAVYALASLKGKRAATLETALAAIDRSITEELTPRYAARSTDMVLAFERIAGDAIHSTGAKAANLAKIRNELSLPVPEGFSVTTVATERFLSENGIKDLIAKGLAQVSPDQPEAFERHSDEIRAAIVNAAVPPDIAGEIIQAYRELEKRTRPGVHVAVRSSAVGEDTEATFAGQYETVLNVAEGGILEAYKQVLASKYSSRAVAYRLRYGLSDRETPMAVAVVAMIDPKASGVMYTSAPSGGTPADISISAVRGLAERLVDGSASPDIFVVDRESRRIKDRRIAKQETRMVNLPSGGTILQPVPVHEQSMSSLDDATVQRLAEYGLKLEKLFGAAQDVEWALDGSGSLFIIQSRPLGGSAAGSRSDAPVGEVTGHQVLLSTGKSASPGIAAGTVFILREGDTAENVPEGAVLVTRTASPDLAKLSGRVSAIITDIGSAASHLASVAREFGVPTIVDAGNATTTLKNGDLVSLTTDPPRIYSGIVGEITALIQPRKKQVFDSPVHRRMRRVLDLVSPLHLTDPGDPSFSPEGCKTVHDIIRYAHEQAVRSMFGLTDEADVVRSIELKAKIPLELRLIDLGGGLNQGLTTCHEVTPELVQSVPFLAIWKGFSHPGVSWEGGIGLNMSKMLTLLSASATSEFGPAPGGVSYAIVSGEYMNLSAKFGYHFATVDAFVGGNSVQNYVSLQFSGGAGSYFGKSLRIAFLGSVLRKLGFQVKLRGDLIEGSITDYDRPALEAKLDQMGRLLASSRLLDMALSNQADVERMTEAFFKADYDFLAFRRDEGLANFYTHGGSWKQAIDDERPVCMQDGSRAGFTISSGVAGAMNRLVGQALQEFLDNVEAYYYFPLAVAKDVRLSDGEVRVRVKPVSGNIDRAGGIAFGMGDVSNYFAFRINALEDNAILFEFINGRRIERASVHEDIASGQWHDLRVEVRERDIRCYLNNRVVLEYGADKPVQGYVGLWTKADSVTFFDGLAIKTETGTTTVVC
ncbi:MAG: PEP/pyruvate-binding domain-containing protein [Nitrospirota bacterium]